MKLWGEAIDKVCKRRSSRKVAGAKRGSVGATRQSGKSEGGTATDTRRYLR